MSSAIDRLRAAERIGRRLQTNVASSDAAAMVRTWSAVAQAAHTAWSSLPTDAQIDDRVVERIALAAESLDHAADRHLWPGKGKAVRHSPKSLPIPPKRPTRPGRIPRLPVKLSKPTV